MYILIFDQEQKKKIIMVFNLTSVSVVLKCPDVILLLLDFTFLHVAQSVDQLNTFQL